ncbi:MAG: AMP-binding protein [Eubacteriales bacterium]|nr:AMP-binding protein [Clostridiales bacterium]MDY5836281.1 AMP-binding protein [Eubacteriales bacterium]
MKILTGKKYFDAPPVHRLGDILERGKTIYGDRPAIVYRPTVKADPVTVNYRQLYDQCQALKEAFLGLGLGGEKIALVGANSFTWMLSYLTICWDLGVACPLDAMLTGVELAQLIQRAEVKAVVLDPPALKSLLPFVADCPLVEQWIVHNINTDKDQDLLQELTDLLQDQKSQIQELQDLLKEGTSKLAQAGPSPDYPLADDELLVLLFTSGTTAVSKAVMLSHANITADIRALLETVKFEDPLRSLSLLPLHHTFENTCGFLSVLSLGGCIHVCDGLRYIGKNIQEYHVHMVIGVPKVFEAIHKRILSNIERSGQMCKFKFGLFLSRILRFFGLDRRRQIFSSILEELGGDFYIAISGAAALSKEVIDFFYDIGIEILQGYGLTETAPVVAGCNTQYNVRGSCGQPLSGVTLAIDSDQADEPGEILVKGDMVMLGYFQDPEASKEVLAEDGWFHTGDIGYIDPKKQVLYLTGRTKSMIVLPSGKKVFPEELESLLNNQEYVKDSLVFGQEDGNGDIVLTAKLVLDKESMAKEGKGPAEIQATLESYIQEINRLVPSFKGIRSYVYSFQDMIKTTTLKVKRNVETQRLQDLIKREQLGWRDLIGVNLDDLENKLAEGHPPLEETEEEKQHSACAEAPPRKLDGLGPMELMQEKLSCLSTYDRRLKTLERTCDQEKIMLHMKQGQQEDLLRLEEEKQRLDLQQKYQADLQALHDQYNRKLLDLRQSASQESQKHMENFQAEANALSKGLYLDLKEFNNRLPVWDDLPPDLQAQSQKLDQALKLAYKRNKEEDKAERKAFRRQLKLMKKDFRSQLEEGKKARKTLLNDNRQAIKTKQGEEREAFAQLKKQNQETIEAHAARTKLLQQEQKQILKDLKEKNKPYSK